MKAEAAATIGLVLLLGLTGCATTTFDRYFEARQFDAAARAFDDDPSLHDRERALFRAGLVRALPDSPAFDPELARTLLERLLRLYPNSSRREHASNLLRMLTELERTAQEAALREAHLEQEVEDLRDQVSRLRRQVTWLETRIEVQEDQARLLHSIIERLESDVRDREERARALSDELDRLKEIDLNPPGWSRENPTRSPGGRD